VCGGNREKGTKASCKGKIRFSINSLQVLRGVCFFFCAIVIHIPRTSIGSLSPFRLPAQRTCGIRLKTPSFSVLLMNSIHSRVAIHSSLARLLRKLTNSNVSCMESLSGAFFFGGPGSGGISTGIVSKRVISGEKAACIEIFFKRVSRRWIGLDGGEDGEAGPGV